jgi:hypothetical protein
MEAEGIRSMAIDDMNREGRTSVLFAGFAVLSLLLIAIWGAAGAGYFWPTWPIAAGAFAFAVAALAQAWSNRPYADSTVRARVAQVSGQAPPGIQR